MNRPARVYRDETNNETFALDKYGRLIEPEPKPCDDCTLDQIDKCPVAHDLLSCEAWGCKPEMMPDDDYPAKCDDCGHLVESHNGLGRLMGWVCDLKPGEKCERGR